MTTLAAYEVQSHCRRAEMAALAVSHPPSSVLCPRGEMCPGDLIIRPSQHLVEADARLLRHLSQMREGFGIRHTGAAAAGRFGTCTARRHSPGSSRMLDCPLPSGERLLPGRGRNRGGRACRQMDHRCEQGTRTPIGCVARSEGCGSCTGLAWARSVGNDWSGSDAQNSSACGRSPLKGERRDWATVGGLSGPRHSRSGRTSIAGCDSAGRRRPAEFATSRH